MRAVILLCLVGVSCGPTSMHAATSTLANCELGRLPTTLEMAIAQVAGVLMSGGDQHWQSDLTNLGVQIGSDQLNCVVAAVGAGIKGQIRKGKATPEYIEGSRRADEWIARGRQ